MSRRAWIALAACLVLVVGVGVLVRSSGGEPKSTFCNSALAFREVMLQPTEVTSVALEDQGSPGRDDCDIGPLSSLGLGMDVLGFDCQVRNVRGSVTGSVAANRADGTCGQAP